MIVLGIDPGTAMTGYGIVSREGSTLRAIDHGCIETLPDRGLPERLLFIHQAVSELIVDHRPAWVGVERLFFNRNVQTAFAVGQARGVVLLAAAQHGVPVMEFGPHEVKIAVTGYGRAPKDQVQRMVQALLGLDRLPRPDDAADALAVAICAAHSHRPGCTGRERWSRAEVIASVEGTVGLMRPDSVVLVVGGVGYRVFAGPNTLAALLPGSKALLHTHHLVREDQQALYGFRTVEELGFFELLLTVTGVGPKVGLAIVASRPVADLQLAIVDGDEAVLTAVSGVGKRLAGRIVLELREKVAAAGGPGTATGGAAESEVAAALGALGYSPGEARDAARIAVGALPPGASLEERVKAALRALRRD